MKKLILLIVSLDLISHFTYGQQNKIDSLQVLLNSDKLDTSKIIHLNELSWELKNINTDTAIILSNEALTLANSLPKELGKSGISVSLNYLGVFYYIKSDFPMALDYYLKAIKMNEEMLGEAKIPADKKKVQKKYASVLGNIGIIYTKQGNYPIALDYNLKALKIFETLLNDGGPLDEVGSYKKKISACLDNIGAIYALQNDFKKALDYRFKSLKLEEELGDKYGIATSLGNIGFVYFNQATQARQQGDTTQIDQGYSNALEYYFKALKMREELEANNLISTTLGNIANVYNYQAAFSRKHGETAQAAKCFRKASDYYLRALKIDEELGNKEGMARHLGNLGSLYTDIGKYKEAEKYFKKAIELNESIGALNDLWQFEELISQLYDTTAQLAAEMGNFNAATANYKQSMMHYRKAMVLKDTLFTQEKNNELTRKEMNYEFDKKETVVKAEQEKKDAIALKEIQKQKLVRNGFIGGFAVMLLFAGVFFAQRIKISKGKKRSDELLLNILPVEVAEELKQKGSAEAKQFDDVTVMFTDFKNFTQISERLTPSELVAEIHTCFKAFDVIISKHNIEKIKTIGDSYMCAGGLPVANKTNAADVVNAALEIQQFIQDHLRQRIAEGKEPFEIRIGIHTGPVVAGIVGVKKFAYDIWGNTVNIASRMESSGETGKVNISNSTYALIKENYNCTPRGKILAKNKGDIEMYFVNNQISSKQI